MIGVSDLENRVDPPGTLGLRAAFVGVWFVDLVATLLFFTVPYADELNPVTVFLHDLFGLVGVVIAAVGYAAFVIGIGHLLSRPLDTGFVALMVGLYALFASNNVVLLVSREPLLTLLVL
ncbi:hypothetical protein E2L06_01645 [Haloterrigena sp. H1]|uniref:hypothetical protein n=1 Tax=Haloterrigena sp. H1 TaxID=2552943 RepID=UPI00110E665D|nr:hypothetical protein [Haloterrigena sp. H1]TMT85372.1 hypothetical protein E2L06_01645 [Haloterrigena sp. H1]